MLFALLSLIIVILCVLCYRLIFQVFNGNSGRNDIVKHSLKEYASARFIRFQPTTSNNYKALRVEVYGILISAGTFCITGFHVGVNVYNESFHPVGVFLKQQY